MLSIFAVLVVIAMTATSCSKSGSNIPKVGSCTDVNTALQLSELITEFGENPSVETCEAYIGYLKAYVNKCASFLSEDAIEDFNNDIDDIDCSAIGEK